MGVYHNISFLFDSTILSGNLNVIGPYETGVLNYTVP
jgi:hypothetical protein